MTTRKVLKAPYRAYNTNDKEVGKFRTEKQAATFAKTYAKTATPVENGYNSILITHLYLEDDIIYEDEVRSYQYSRKV